MTMNSSMAHGQEKKPKKNKDKNKKEKKVQDGTGSFCWLLAPFPLPMMFWAFQN